MHLSFFRAFRAEWIKVKGPAVKIALIALPLLAVFLGTGNFTANREMLSGNPWLSYWTQIALFYGYFFYPLLLAVIASYLFTLEHQEHNWNALMTTGLSPANIWLSKLAVLFVFAVLCQAEILVLYFLVGKLVLDLPSPFPWAYAFYWLTSGPLCVMGCATLQLYLSERIRSFAIPIGISFVLCIIGLACYAKGIWFFPNTLAIIGINAQHQELPTLIEIFKTVSASFFWTMAFSAAGLFHLKRSDVRSE